MAKLTNIQQSFNNGLSLALQIAKEKGIEGLEAELKFRGITGLHTHLSKSDIEKVEKIFKKQVILYYTAASLYTLKEKFGFGKVRLKKYYDQFEDLCDSVMRDYLTLDDVVQYLKDQYEIDLNFKEGKGVKIKKVEYDDMECLAIEDYAANIPVELEDMYLCVNGIWSCFEYTNHNGAVMI